MPRLLLLSLAVLLAPALEAPSKPSFDRVRSLIREQLAAEGVASLAVAVVRNGEIIWAEGFGWADRENRVPATEHTMYSLASVSKPVTATALMILKQRGKLDLDRPVNDYLGEAKLRGRAFPAEEATVRRVAAHTSGLPLHHQFFYEDEPWRPPSMDETIRRYGNLVTPPGERYQYSNLGYGIIDYVISRVSGKPYEDFLREEVFLPLGMTRSSIGLGPRLEQHQAIRYGTDGLPIPFYDFDHRGGSAVYASAHDLARFALFHLKTRLAGQKRILDDGLVEEMREPRWNDYGIGWRVQTGGSHRIVSHTGGMGGVSTIVSLAPSEKMGVVVLSNSRNPLPARICNEILATLLPGFRNAASAEPSPKDPGKEFLGTWTGSVHTYREEIPLSLRFLESGDIHARLGGQLATLLNGSKVVDGYLTGRMMGNIGTEDANRRPYVLEVILKRRGEILNGAMTALSLPGKRVGNALTHWVELRRQ